MAGKEGAVKPEHIQALREAGAVKRCHTIPIHGHYDVAQHCWNAVTLLFCLHPDPSPALIKAVLYHDAGERYVGDLPAPAKWFSPDLSLLHGRLEDMILERLGLNIDLLPEDWRWLKSLDLLEFYLFCLDQKAFGNQHILKCLEAVKNWFHEQHERIPVPIQQFYNNHKWSRTDELTHPTI